MKQFLFDYAGCPFRVVVDGNDELGKRLVARAFAEPVHGHMDAADSGLHRGETVRRDETVVVVSVEINAQVRGGGVNPVEITRHLFRRQNAERIGQHHSLDFHFGKTVQKFEYVRQGIDHAVGPVFKINVDGKPHFPRLFDFSADVGEMLFRLLAELYAAMSFRPFREQVQNFAAATANPVRGFSSIDESENLHAFEAAAMFRPFEDGAEPDFFPFGDTRGTDFQSVNMQVRNEKACNLKLFSGSVSDAGGLLAVAQCGVEHLDITGESVCLFHFFTCLLVDFFG